MGTKLGLNAKLYYGPYGSTATNELTNTKDVTLNLEDAEADATSRASEGWRETEPTLHDGSIEFEMNVDEEDPGYNALADAYFGRTKLAILCLDEENGRGLDADMRVSKFTRSEPLEGVITVSVAVKPARSTRAPSWQNPGA